MFPSIEHRMTVGIHRDGHPRISRNTVSVLGIPALIHAEASPIIFY